MPALRHAILESGQVPAELANQVFAAKDNTDDLRMAILKTGQVTQESAAKLIEGEPSSRLWKGMLDRDLVTSEVATAVFGNNDYGLPHNHRVALMKKGLITDEVLAQTFANPQTYDSLRIAIFGEGQVDKSAAEKAFRDPQTSDAVRLAILEGEVIQSVGAKDLSHAKDAAYLRKLIDVADDKAIESFVQNGGADAKLRVLALDHVDDSKVIYRVATVGGNLQLRAAAILRLGDEGLVIKAAKLTLAQLDAATFADNLSPEKREKVRAALLDIVGNYYNPAQKITKDQGRRGSHWSPWE